MTFATHLDGMPLSIEISQRPRALAETIDPSDPENLARWALNFGITTEALLIAVNQAGYEVRDLAVHLQIVPDTNRR